MDGLLITTGIILLVGIPVSIVVLLFWVAGQGRKLRALEDRLDRIEARPRPVSAPKPKPRPEAPIAAKAVRAKAEEDAKTAGPWQPGKDQPAGKPAPSEPLPPPTQTAAPPRAFVMRASKARALGAWLSTNWIYLVAAISLALAGIFLLQYGIENGLLPPAARVAMALAFGAGLVAAGEYLRRRWGDSEDSSTAFLPSVFSGAGIIVLFAAVLAALHLYALIGPLVALVGLVAVALLAVVLGWYSGPLLAGLGVAGAFISPFLVGGESDATELFFGYFGLITLMGLAIDAIRRWAWVSVLTLVMAYGAAFMLHAGLNKPEYFMLLLAVLALAAIALPPLSLSPSHKGAAIINSFAKGLPRGWPEFPTRLAGGAMLASVAMIVLASGQDSASFWLAAVLLVALFAAIALWARRAEALEDLAVLPVLGLLALPVLNVRTMMQGFYAFLEAEPGTPMPLTPFILVAMAAGISLMAAWRSLSGARWPLGWAGGAALAGPLMMVALEVWWLPGTVIGAYPWALAAAAMAVLMGLMAGWFAKVDGDDKRRVALLVLASLSMISFAFILVLSEVALTLALALTLLAAAFLDRRFNMPALAFFVQVGVVVISARLIIWPGLLWAEHAGLGHVVAVFAGSIAVMVLAHSLLRPLGRRSALLVLESAAWSLTAIFASTLIIRLLGVSEIADTHWIAGLHALVWLISAANQLWRLQAGGKMMVRLRLGLAIVFGLVGALLLLIALGPESPLNSRHEVVLGPVLLNSLMLAYLAPALLLGIIAWRYRFLPNQARMGLTIAASALAVFWLFLAIRHAWQGPVLAGPGFMQGELYTYTIAMLLTGAGLLYQSIAKGSTLLRRVAMAVIALTVVKVFFIDASGLTGLTRVFSFLALGLSLAGLAWLNRWAAGRAGGEPDAEPKESEAS